MAEIAGRNAQALRREAGVNLQDFARALRRYGLSWSTGRVGDFEGGRAAPSLATLFVIAAALRVATGRDVKLADLFEGMGPVQINDKLSVQLWAVRAALEGKPVRPVQLTAKVTAIVPIVHTQNLPEWARGIDSKLIARVLGRFVETDERLCKRLGIQRDVGAAAMAKRWRRTFTAERDRRAGSDAKPQRRGQISRQLQTELQKVIHDGDD
ncbi:MAG TPA: helix-turn-helix transcriptional regulator [Mycobacterium sp.]|nr:helix-turn-helix transcriptional regulator [Mycobacterium sp.]